MPDFLKIFLDALNEAGARFEWWLVHLTHFDLYIFAHFLAAGWLFFLVKQHEQEYRIPKHWARLYIFIGTAIVVHLVFTLNSHFNWVP